MFKLDPFDPSRRTHKIHRLDGQDMVVSGATLTVDERHYFNSLLLTIGAVLTHSPCTASETHRLDLVVSK